MLGRYAKQLCPLVEGCRSYAAVPDAVQAVKSEKSGFLSMLGLAPRMDTPMSHNFPFPDFSRQTHLAPKLEVTSLASGVKVASINTPAPKSSMALYFDAGTSYETAENEGASKFLEYVMFKSTTNRSTFRITRELEKMGAKATVKSGREGIVISVSAPKIHAPAVMEILTDCVFNPRFVYYETRDTIELAQRDVQHILANPFNMLIELSHRAGFEGGLARPGLPDPEACAAMNNEVISDFASGLLIPSKMVTAATGVEHGLLTSGLPTLLPESGTGFERPKSSYVGGSLSAVAHQPLNHVGLSFEVKGGRSSMKNEALAAIAKVLLDESRVVLPRQRKDFGPLEYTTSFCSLYKTTGLIGLLGSATPGNTSAAVDHMIKKLHDAAKGVSDAQVNAAKAAVATNVAVSTSVTTNLAVTIGAQLAQTGAADPALYLSTILSVSTADVNKFFQDMVKSTPTVAAYGALGNIPRVEAITKKFVL